MSHINNIGFMQGRLSNIVDGKIQAFPWLSWQDEFIIACLNNFQYMEWTLDYDRLYDNPLMTLTGQREIITLSDKYNLNINTLTADCFMQAPFWIENGIEQEIFLRNFQAIVSSCAAVGIRIIIFPLVDNSRLKNSQQEDSLVFFLQNQLNFLLKNNIKIAFETDLGPIEMARFISRFESSQFGINYDIGNSAALGFNPSEEINSYGLRIINVHIKDRILGGTTVPLGEGNADFNAVFTALSGAAYGGIYILQTARADYGFHDRVLCRYRDMAVNFLEQHAT